VRAATRKLALPISSVGTANTTESCLLLAILVVFVPVAVEDAWPSAPRPGVTRSSPTFPCASGSCGPRVTIPWPRRFLFARRPEVARGVLDVALRAIFAWYRVRGREVGVLDGKRGAITVIQRAGSAANLNIHFHSLVLDGVFARDEKTGVPHFHGVRPPTQEEIKDLVATVAHRAERWLGKQGFGVDQEDVPVEEDPDDAQVLLIAASMEGRSALRGRRTRRKGVSRNPEGLPHRCAAFEGYNLHADTQVPARDRPGLERLCRYILRPPLAKTRIEETAEGEIRLTLKRPWADGTAEMLFTKQEFLERLCALVPPPRSNSILYHGVLAGHAAMRSSGPVRDHPQDPCPPPAYPF